MPQPPRGRYYRSEPREERGRRIMNYGQQLAPTSAPAETQQDRQNEGDADFWRFLGDVAPAAGGVAGAIGGGILGGIGGPAGIVGGATAGAGLGYGLGQMGGQAAHSFADSKTADREDAEANHALEEQQKADRKSALLATLMGMR